MTISLEAMYIVVLFLLLLMSHFFYKKREIDQENSSLHSIIDALYFNCRSMDKLLTEYYKELCNLKVKCTFLDEKNKNVDQLHIELSELQKKHHAVLTENHHNLISAKENAKVAIDVFNVLQRVKKIDPNIVLRAEDQLKKEVKMRKALNAQKSKKLKIVKRDTDDEKKT